MLLFLSHSVPFSVQITFPPYLSYNESIPHIIYYYTEGTVQGENNLRVWLTQAKERREMYPASLSLTVQYALNTSTE